MRVATTSEPVIPIMDLKIGSLLTAQHDLDDLEIWERPLSASRRQLGLIMAGNRKPWSTADDHNSEIRAEKRKKPLKSSDLRPDCWSNDALTPHWTHRNLADLDMSRS